MTGIYLLNDPKLIKEKAAGSKAMNLGRLLSLGFPVPKGFCITGYIYREHLEKNNLLPQIRTTLEKITGSGQGNSSELLSDLRTAIIKAPVSESTKRDIKKQYEMLNPKYVAVRSSATAEDLPSQSFAGQYETCLGIKNSDQCIEAIKKCWSSLWTQRAFEYRRKNKIDHLQIDMAVIIQELIPADTAGVIFTADPLTGRRKSIVIEACLGLGEALVFGKMTPDRFIVDKDTRKMFAVTISEKKLQCFLDENGAVQEKEISNKRATAPSLDKKQIIKLAKLALKVETKLGCPQDTEWAIKNNRIWLLQSRPITNLPTPKEKSWQDRQIWTNINVGEVAPDVVTPLTKSFIKPTFDKMFNNMISRIGIEVIPCNVLGEVTGRFYFNVNVGVALMAPLVSLVPLRFQTKENSENAYQLFGGREEYFSRLNIEYVPKEDLPKIRIHWMKLLALLPLQIIQSFPWTIRKTERLTNRQKLMMDKDLQENFQTDSTEKLLQKIRNNLSIIHSAFQKLPLFGSGMSCIFVFNWMCRRWLNDQHRQVASSLLSGSGQMADAQAGIELLKLAEYADEYPAVKQALLSGKNFVDVKEHLQTSKGGNDFLQRWDEFMFHHGHHTRGEIEVINPRWIEQPDYVLKMIVNNLDHPEKSTLVQEMNNRNNERNRLLEKCRRQIRNPVKRRWFLKTLKNAQRGLAVRENFKNELIRRAALLRYQFLELACRLQQKNDILEQNDIFFLKNEEIEPVIFNRVDFNVKETITKRRTEYDKNSKVKPPPVVIGHFNPDKYFEESIDVNREILTGISVSPGIAIGTARVILRASDDHVRPGEILVAPFTDPGWTPYFVNAVGIVMDMGGLLSHGSIVAREYGIPCVVNVGSATKIIKTGQKIKVDGNSGVVKILG